MRDQPSAVKEDREARRAKERRRQFRRLQVARADGLLRGVLSQLGPGDIAVDCGANVGTVTLQLADTGAQVHAFEPDPVAFDRLAKSAAGRPNVTLYNAAVGVAPGRAVLMRAAGFRDDPLAASARSSVVPGGNRMETDPETGIDVEVVPLHDLLEDWIADAGRVAFLKLDIEGAELEILQLMLDRRLFDGIGLTVAETHTHKFPALRERFLALRQAISEAYPKTRVDLDWV